MKKSPGFTFVEIMLATSIFAIVAVAIYSIFSAGVSTWRNTEQTQSLYQDVRLALDTMARDLQNALVYSQDNLELSDFDGENKKISFYTLVDQFQQVPVHPELKRVTYSCNESTHILERQELTFAESAQETQQQQPQEIAAKISNLDFFYSYYERDALPPYIWEDKWEFKKCIPQAVKITLELDSKGKPVFAKYVFIPTGESKEPAAEED